MTEKIYYPDPRDPILNGFIVGLCPHCGTKARVGMAVPEHTLWAVTVQPPICPSCGFQRPVPMHRLQEHRIGQKVIYRGVEFKCVRCGEKHHWSFNPVTPRGQAVTPAYWLECTNPDCGSRSPRSPYLVEVALSWYRSPHEWISVEEAVPLDNTAVQVFCEEVRCIKGRPPAVIARRFQDPTTDKYYWQIFYQEFGPSVKGTVPTHWRPLPLPPIPPEPEPPKCWHWCHEGPDDRVVRDDWNYCPICGEKI